MRTEEEHSGQLCFYSTVWRIAEAGLYRSIKRILVSSDVFDSLNWIEMDGDLIGRITRDDQLPALTCWAQTECSCQHWLYE